MKPAFVSARELDYAGLTTEDYDRVVFAKDQPEYLQLPAIRLHDKGFGAEDQQVISTWALSWRERMTLLLTGRLHISHLTFGTPLQPIKPHVMLSEGLGARNAD